MFCWIEHKTSACMCSPASSPCSSPTSCAAKPSARAGLRLSVRELLSQLAGIGETVLIYPSSGGRPKARRASAISAAPTSTASLSRSPDEAQLMPPPPWPWNNSLVIKNAVPAR
jgi:hypothetical protein